jgi:acetyl-CoA carboxylase carboxyltransferase component
MYANSTYSMDEILGLVDPDIRQPLDMLEVVLRLVDGSRISQFKPQFGRGMLTVWARIHGEYIRIQKFGKRGLKLAKAI